MWLYCRIVLFSYYMIQTEYDTVFPLQDSNENSLKLLVKKELPVVEDEEEEPSTPPQKVKTKGAGAGGAKTNKNGLSYEAATDLITNCISLESKGNKSFCLIQFSTNGKKYKLAKQSKLFKCMEKAMQLNIYHAHGCKNPDECYIDEDDKIMYIIEKKFQQVGGSVCEKIQTPDFKIWQYSSLFPDYHIVYMYCLSDWFKINCKRELQYLEYKKIPVFWGDDVDYKTKMIDFIQNYKR